MAGDSFWGVIGDVANTAAEDIGRYQERKRELSEEHKRELRRQAVENARREQQDRAYGLQERRFEETQQQGLRRDEAQNARWEQEDRRYGLQERRLDEQERHNRVSEEPQPKEWQQPPDIVSEAKAGLTSEIKDWRTSNTPRAIGQQSEYPYRTIYDSDPNASKIQPTMTNSGLQDVPSQLDLARTKAEFNRLPADSVEWRLTGQPTGRFGMRPPLRTSFTPTQQPASQPSYKGQALGGLRSFNQPQQTGRFGPDGSYPTYEAWQEAKAMGIPGA